MRVLRVPFLLGVVCVFEGTLILRWFFQVCACCEGSFLGRCSIGVRVLRVPFVGWCLSVCVCVCVCVYVFACFEGTCIFDGFQRVCVF